MKSLFVRLLVSMWLTMTLIGGLFAVIALAFASRPDDSRRLMVRYLDTRGEAMLHCIERGGDCESYYLTPNDSRLAIYKDGAVVAGQPIEGAAELVAEAAASSDRLATRIADPQAEAARSRTSCATPFGSPLPARRSRSNSAGVAASRG